MKRAERPVAAELAVEAYVNTKRRTFSPSRIKTMIET
jgi:hypothetical protein